MNTDDLTFEELDEVMGDARPSDEEVLGLSLKEFGKGFLGTQAIAGRVLLSAFGMGAVADQMEDLQNKGGVLPDWASKHLTVESPNTVAFDTGAEKPVVVRHVHKISIYGGSRVDGNGYDPKIRGTFSFGVEKPVRVEMLVKDPKAPASQPKVVSRTDVQKMLVFGGNESGTLEKAGSAAGGGGITGMFGGAMGGNSGKKDQVKGSNTMANDEIGSIIEELGYTEIVGSDDCCWQEIVGDDHALGTHVLGAAPTRRVQPRAGYVARTTPNGNKILSLEINPARKGDKHATIKNANDVGKHAVSIGTRLLSALNRPTTKVRGDEILGGLEETVEGMEYDVLGAAAPRPKPKKGKRRILSRAEIKKIAESTVKAGNKLLATSEIFAKLVATNDEKTKKGVEKAAKQLSKSKMNSNASVLRAQGPQKSTARPAAKSATQRSVVRGDEVLGGGDYDEEILGADSLTGFEDDFEILGLEAQAEMLGVELETLYGGQIVDDEGSDEVLGADDDDNSGGPVDTFEPGAASAPDQYAAMASDPNVDPYADPDMPVAPTLASVRAAVLANPASNGYYKFTADPKPDGVDWGYYTEGMKPSGAVNFQGVPALDQDSEASLGSLNRFLYDPAVKASKDSANPYSANVKGGKDSGFQYNKDGWQTYDDAARYGYSGINASEGVNLNAASAQINWGPIVGRPGTPFSGLRSLPGSVVSALVGTSGSMQLFWYFDKAPSALQDGKLQEALQLALVAYQTELTAYKAGVAAKAAADQLDKEQAAAIAKQNAREAKQTAHQIEIDTAKTDARVAQQTAVDNQAQATQTAYDQQQVAIETQYSQAQSQIDQQEYAAITETDHKHQMEMLKFAAENPQMSQEGSESYNSEDPLTAEMLSESASEYDYATDEGNTRSFDQMDS